MPDYRNYYFSWKEWILCIVIAGGVTGIIAWLFYRSVCALVLFLFWFLITKKQLKEQLWKKREQDMLEQFRGMIQAIAGLLKAGYSMERAFQEGVQDFAKLYGTKCIMYQEFASINRQLKMNVPIEKLLEDLAERSGIEEIDSFSQVLGFAKRGGGNLVKVFQESVEKIAERAEVKREIETVIAAKKLEQNIMALVPCAILIYLGIGMPEFLAPLYGNPTGVFAMSLCLTVYGFAFRMAQKIVEIKG